VAVLDATNSTEERRSFLRSRFHGKWQYLFIESICNDMEVSGQEELVRPGSSGAACAAGSEEVARVWVVCGRRVCG
jgi:hypothetical protein